MGSPEDEKLNTAYERTVASDDFSPEATEAYIETVDNLSPGLDITDSDSVQWYQTPDGETGASDDADLTPVSGDLQSRYRMVETLGEGTTGHVYLAQDVNFERDVAIKVLKSRFSGNATRREKFIREARIAAKLDHPNVTPVYDLNLEQGAKPYFTMKPMRGVSLRQVIYGDDKAAPIIDQLQGLSEKLQVILKVCDGVSFAHAQDVIHQDIKPDNIMLGKFGEVFVVDWGEASLIDGSANSRIVGSPAYMSPEQARKEDVDKRSDVYCLGATMFQWLYQQYPTWSRDIDLFWDKKRRGIIDDIPEEKIAQVPKALRAIIAKAIAPERAERYANATELAADIRGFLSDNAIAAYQMPIWERAYRYYRRNKQSIQIVALFLMVSGVLLYQLYQEKVKELFTWKEIASYTFDDPNADVSKHWQAYRSENWVVHRAVDDLADIWFVENGMLVCQNDEGYENLSHRLPIYGNFRVEWDVRAVENGNNLNSYIGGKHRKEGYMFHVGGFEKPRSVILTKGEGVDTLFETSLERPLAVGQTYRMRIEREDRFLRLYIDGQPLVNFEDFDLLSGVPEPSFGFEVGAGNRVTLDNISVYQQRMPLRINPMQVPNALANQGLYEAAIQKCMAILDTHSDESFAEVVRFKLGLCYVQVEQPRKALKQFKYLASQDINPRLLPFVLYRLMSLEHQLYPEKDLTDYVNRLSAEFPKHAVHMKIYNDVSAALMKKYVLDHTLETVQHFAELQDWKAVESDINMLSTMAIKFGISVNHNKFYSALVSTAMVLERPGWVLEHLGFLPSASFHALFETNRESIPLLQSSPELHRDYQFHYAGRIADLVTLKRDFPSKVSTLRGALTKRGIWPDNWKETYSESQKRYVLIAQGKGEDAIKTPGVFGFTVTRALYALGDFEGLLQHPQRDHVLKAYALLGLGRVDDALERYGLFPIVAVEAAMLRREEVPIFENKSHFQREAYAKNYTRMRRYFMSNGASWEPLDTPANLEAYSYYRRDRLIYSHFIIPPVLASLASGKDDIEGEYRKILEEQLKYSPVDNSATSMLLRYVLGEIDDNAFTAQPNKVFIEGRWALARALRAERAGNTADMIKYYEAYKGLQPGKKQVVGFLEAFVDFRLAQLKK